MKILLILLFLPLALVIGLIKGVLNGIFGATNLKYIPKAIVHLAKDTYPLGTAFKEIKFPQVLSYAQEVGTITQKESNYFEFEVNIQDSIYSVNVSRATDGSNCAILHSKKKLFSKPLSIRPTHQVKQKDALSSDIIEQLENSYNKHNQKCKW